MRALLIAIGAEARAGRNRGADAFEECLKFLGAGFWETGSGGAAGELTKGRVCEENATKLIGDEQAGVEAVEEGGQFFHKLQ